jgi:plastocyanin
MLRSIRSRITWVVLTGLLAITFAPQTAETKPRRPKYATKADLERVEQKLEEQRELVVKLIKLQQQYLQSLLALTGEGGPVAAVAPDPVQAKPEPKPEPKPRPVVRPAVAAKPKPPVKPEPEGFGTIVGKVEGGGGQAVVYIDHIGPLVRRTASMKQQGKQFHPQVLVVQRGTKVEFPNLDAVFHNVFSVTPDNSFDLGSYRQGDSKAVNLVKPGVVTVYCNMHPQMVGHILVVPSALHARTGGDGFYKIANVPAGKHRVVAWAPNAKPVVSEIEVGEGAVASVEFKVKRRGIRPHTNKDGMPYGSYKD